MTVTDDSPRPTPDKDVEIRVIYHPDPPLGPAPVQLPPDRKAVPAPHAEQAPPAKPQEGTR
jgi:hypothetical protein